MGRGDTAVGGEVGEEGGDFGAAALGGLEEADVLLDPVEVSAFGTEGEVLDGKLLASLFEELRVGFYLLGSRWASGIDDSAQDVPEQRDTKGGGVRRACALVRAGALLPGSEGTMRSCGRGEQSRPDAQARQMPRGPDKAASSVLESEGTEGDEAEKKVGRAEKILGSSVAEAVRTARLGRVDDRRTSRP